MLVVESFEPPEVYHTLSQLPITAQDLAKSGSTQVGSGGISDHQMRSKIVHPQVNWTQFY